ncbi:MAG: metallophosphoesterase [Acidimicrobiia bacterium]|nr:metallophosphoesterase [Acidimicrobiia bacterium]
MIRIVSDVHGAAAALGRVVRGDSPLLVLGDLINFIDYRDNSGIVSDVAGRGFVDRVVELRARGDYAAAGELWRDYRKGREDELRERYALAIRAEYSVVCEALRGVDAYVTYGNVDNPAVMRELLPSSARFVEAEVVTLDDRRIGIVGGGVPTINSPGEISDAEMAKRLATIGPVDILCTHVAPAIAPLATDVIGGRQKGSPAVLAFIEEHQPGYHYFGDIHQPQAVSWRIGRTLSQNVGYFRATGRVVVHRES